MDLAHEKRLTEVEERSKSNSHRLDDVEKRQNDLDKIVNTVARLDEREKTVEADVKEIKTDVKNIKNIPAKRWEQIVSIVIAAVAGYLLSELGL